MCTPGLASAGAAADLRDRARSLVPAYAPQLSRLDFAAIIDFSAPSWKPRFHLIDVETGATTSLLVAHGRGSDPAHTGWLRHFSNAPGSYATSQGAYRTASLYEGKYGRSMRLIGLDADNSNAEARAIVIHPAWYVGETMLEKYGKLGRSEGCFAVSESDLNDVLDRLAGGCLLYAGKF